MAPFRSSLAHFFRPRITIVIYKTSSDTDSESAEPELKPPDWYTAHCVQTAAEVADTQPTLSVRLSGSLESNVEGNGVLLDKEQPDRRYRTEEDIYKAAKSFMLSANPDLRIKWGARRTPTRNAMVLRLAASSDDKCLESSAFFKSVVHSLARDSNAASITLGWDDVENLAEEYTRENELESWDPADPEWISYLTFAIGYGMPRAKRFTSTHNPRTILHITDISNFAATSEGRAFLQHVQRVIQDAFPRNPVTLILSGPDKPATNSAETKPTAGTPGVCETQDLLLISSPSDRCATFSLPLIDSSLGMKGTSSIRQQDKDEANKRKATHAVQKKLRRLCPTKWNHPVLQPYAEFPSVDLLTDEMDSIFYHRFAAALDRAKDGQNIERIILGQLLDVGVDVDIERIDGVPADEEGSADLSLPDLIQGVVKQVEEDTERYKWENLMLSSIIDPTTIRETWSDIHISPGLKSSLMQMVGQSKHRGPMQYGLLRNGRIKGALSYGAPGTGKTQLARIVARESGLVMMHVSAADLHRKYRGESEKCIKATFNLARMIGRAIIFIDEADSLLMARDESTSNYRRMHINQFLEEADGLQQSDVAPFLLLATNNPELIDPAVLRRVPGRLFLGLPTCAAREAILLATTRLERIDPALDFAALARRTVRYSGSDLNAVCVKAAMLCEDQLATEDATRERGPRQRRVLATRHFEAAITHIGPTTPIKTSKRLSRFAAEYDPAALPLNAAALKEAENDGEGRPQDADSSFMFTVSGVPSSTALYTELDPSRQEIRLLWIRNSGWHSAGVECELRVVSLQDAPRFTALSYVWGDKTATEDISVNGETLCVTRNLHRALRVALHHWWEHFPNRGKQEFCLWADAICIDQSSIAERNHQVSLMKKIYSQAELVISSLDVGNPWTELAITTLNAIHEVIFGRHGDGQQSMSDDDIKQFKWLEKLPSLRCDGTGNDENAQDAWSAIDYFQAEHPYFRRVWILQEVVLAREVVFVSDTYSISLERLNDLADTFQITPTVAPSRPEFIPPTVWRLARKFQAGGGFMNIHIYAHIKEQQDSTEAYEGDSTLVRGWGTHFLATGILWLGATDPRDYIYGMLGLMGIDMEVDYNKSVAQVYKEFCELRLELSSDQPWFQHFLTHWSGIGFSTPPNDGTSSAEVDVLPTWAPSYKLATLAFMPKSANSNHNKDTNARAAFRGMRKTVAFQSLYLPWLGEGITAHKGVFDNVPQWADITPVIDADMSLQIPGVRLQQVRIIQSFNHDDDARRHGISAAFSAYCAELARRPITTQRATKKPMLLMILQTLTFRDSRKTVDDTSVDAETRLKAFILFMFLEQHWRRRETNDKSSPSQIKPKRTSHRPNFEAAYAQFQSLFFHPLYHKPNNDNTEWPEFKTLWDRGIPDLLAECDADPPISLAIEDLAECVHIFSACPWFETDEGYVGRGPPHMRVDDVVCVVKGCGMPILLRKVGEGYYKHIGPCFLEGVMNGEARGFLLEGRAEVEVFRIR